MPTVRGDLFRIREWYGCGPKPNTGLRMLAQDISAGIVQRELNWGIHGRVMDGPADASIFSVENGMSIADDMEQSVRIDGVLYEGIRFDPSDKSPGSRKQGWQLLRQRLANAKRQGYWTMACTDCPLKVKCTPSPMRRIRRWEHEAVLDEAQRRLDLDPEKMAVRRCTAEHPFGTLKSWMGATHFLTRTKERVSAEMSLHVLACNMKRMIKIMGIGPLLEAIRTHGEALMAFLWAIMANIRHIRRFLALIIAVAPKRAPG